MTIAPDIFFSYNSEDQTRAELFAAAFEGQVFKVCWDAGLRTGKAFDEVTEIAVRTARAVAFTSAVLLNEKSGVCAKAVRTAMLMDASKA